MKSLKRAGIRRLFSEAVQNYSDRTQLCFVLQSVKDPHNVGHLFRIADACGASEVILCGRSPVPPREEIDRTARGHQRRVAWRSEHDVLAALEERRHRGYQVIALETCDESRPYATFEYSDRVCLVLGNESRGVDARTLDRCDHAVFIPMLGKGPSLNVHVAAAIVAFHILDSHRQDPIRQEIRG